MGGSWIDEFRQVSDEDTLNFARGLAAEEGLSVGTSSGAAMFAACELAAELGPGKKYRGGASKSCLRPGWLACPLAMVSVPAEAESMLRDFYSPSNSYFRR